MQRRPGFPARLPTAGNAGSAPGAPRTVAARAAPLASAPQGVGLDSAAVRARMVQRLAASGIGATAVLHAMEQVPRHHFVDTALANQAYEDTSLPIGLGQTTGCGYQAAVLARVAREVYTLERLRALHEKARDNLRPLRLANLHLIFGDGMLGYPKGAPYAAIIAAAGGDQLPESWCHQLAPGGRLVAPLADAQGRQMLLVVDKTPQGFQQVVLEAVHFVPLKSGVG